MKISTLLFCSILFAVPGFCQDYSNYAAQNSRLEKITKTWPQFTRLTKLTTTSGGKSIWMLSVGSGDHSKKPAIAVVGGVEGNHLLGTELAIGFAEKLLQASSADSIQRLLKNTTFYVFPNMSPDAMEQYFSNLKYERQGNAVATDDDRDGKINEDPFEDLNGDGKISMMRIASPVGEYKTHPDDPRVMVKADISKGEKGMYRLLQEGIDNDKDGLFNEDGEGGIWFNKNLSYKPPVFTQGSGEYPVSEKETRALLDTLYELFNVFAVVSFSSSNNLSVPQSYNMQAANQRIIGSWLEDDIKINAMASDLYNKITATKDAPKTTAAGGDFFSWAYYHYGRFSFSTPGWWIPKVAPDTTKKEKAIAVEDATVGYLRWASKNGISNTFQNWQSINHPDFPGQTVEIGGLDPFALVNPPYRLVDSITRKHTEFLVKLAALQPGIEIINLKKEKLGNGLTRITADIINNGAFPTHSKLGERSYWVKRIHVRLNTNKDQSVISGRKIQVLNTLPSSGIQKVSWLVKGSGSLTLDAGSPSTGTTSIRIDL